MEMGIFDQNRYSAENIRYDFWFYVQLVASYRCIIGKAALPREFKDHFVLVTVL